MTFKEFCKAKGIELTPMQERWIGAVETHQITFSGSARSFGKAHLIRLYQLYKQEHKS